MQSYFEKKQNNFSFRSSSKSSSNKSLSLSPSPILETNTRSVNLKQSSGLDAPFIKTIPSACPLREPLPDVLYNYEKIPQIQNPGRFEYNNNKKPF